MLAAEVFGSPLCHRPKSRSHRRSTGAPNRSAPCPLRPTQTPAERPSSEASRQVVVRMRKAWPNAVRKYALLVCFAEGLFCFRATAHTTTKRSDCADAARAGKRLCMRSLLHLVDPNHLIAVGGHSVAQTTVEPRVRSLPSLVGTPSLCQARMAHNAEDLSAFPKRHNSPSGGAERHCGLCG